MDEEYIRGGMMVLRRGGKLVHYGGPQSLSGFPIFLAKLGYYTLLPNGKAIEGYGTHRLGVDLFKQDWRTLFSLLEQGQIKPIIAARLPILEAAKANAMLESGQVTGNAVLLAPGFLSGDKST
jgi:NADPH:quinone reductase-like Zn-dependent oxidoreductase